MRIWPLLKENLHWVVGTGAAICCWKDPWVPNVGPLNKNLVELARFPADCFLEEMLSAEGAWNIEAFKVALSDSSCRQSQIFLPHILWLARLDRLFWIYSANGKITVNNANYTLKHHTWNMKDTKWKTIRQYKGPHRVRFFLWLVQKENLLTNLECV